MSDKWGESWTSQDWRRCPPSLFLPLTVISAATAKAKKKVGEIEGWKKDVIVPSRLLIISLKKKRTLSHLSKKIIFGQLVLFITVNVATGIFEFFCLECNFLGNYLLLGMWLIC